MRPAPKALVGRKVGNTVMTAHDGSTEAGWVSQAFCVLYTADHITPHAAVWSAATWL